MESGERYLARTQPTGPTDLPVNVNAVKLCGEHFIRPACSFFLHHIVLHSPIAERHIKDP